MNIFIIYIFPVLFIISMIYFLIYFPYGNTLSSEVETEKNVVRNNPTKYDTIIHPQTGRKVVPHDQTVADLYDIEIFN